MNRSAILFGLALAVVPAGAGDPPAANPLAGQRFRSVDKLPGGERRDGTVVMTEWEVRFKGTEYSWRHHDVIAVGTYAFDPKTGAVTVNDGKGGPEASFDAKTGVLIWDKRKYKAAGDKK
jgi:hypothetical protein